jgi:hypothetical protein
MEGSIRSSLESRVLLTQLVQGPKYLYMAKIEFTELSKLVQKTFSRLNLTKAHPLSLCNL